MQLFSSAKNKVSFPGGSSQGWGSSVSLSSLLIQFWPSLISNHLWTPYTLQKRTGLGAKKKPVKSPNTIWIQSWGTEGILQDMKEPRRRYYKGMSLLLQADNTHPSDYKKKKKAGGGSTCLHFTTFDRNIETYRGINDIQLSGEASTKNGTYWCGFSEGSFFSFLFLFLLFF